MFYYISGTVAYRGEGFVVIDAGGVGYKLFVSSATLEKIGEVNSFAKLYVYSNFKASADIFDLYGFYDLEEKQLFEMIIGVSRVGAKTAITLHSNISPSKFALCVITNDSKYIASKTPGLGAKGAERIVRELKAKFKDANIGDMSSADITEVYHGGNTERDEAAGAVVVLGYSPQEAKRAVADATGTVEEMVKQGLKNLMKG